jgi:hypothetical protein
MTGSGRATQVQPWVNLLQSVLFGLVIFTVAPSLGRKVGGQAWTRVGRAAAGVARGPADSTSSMTPPCSSYRTTPPAMHGARGRLRPPGQVDTRRDLRRLRSVGSCLVGIRSR